VRCGDRNPVTVPAALEDQRPLMPPDEVVPADGVGVAETGGEDSAALGVGDGAGEVCTGGVVPVGCGAGDVVCRSGL
jgi:hypothetical protein